MTKKRKEKLKRAHRKTCWAYLFVCMDQDLPVYQWLAGAQRRSNDQLVLKKSPKINVREIEEAKAHTGLVCFGNKTIAHVV